MTSSMENGKSKPGTATLLLTMDMLTHTMTVDGDAPNLDTFIAMLDQAKRQFDLKQKIEGAKLLQAQLQEHVENQRIASLIRK